MKKTLTLALILASQTHPESVVISTQSATRAPCHEGTTQPHALVTSETAEDEEELDPLALSQRPRPSPQPSAQPSTQPSSRPMTLEELIQDLAGHPPTQSSGPNGPEQAAATGPGAPPQPCAGSNLAAIQPSPIPEVTLSIPFISGLPDWLTEKPQAPLPAEKEEKPETPPQPEEKAEKPKAVEVRPCSTDHEFVTHGKIKLSRFSSRRQERFCVVTAAGFTDTKGTTRGLSWNSEGGFSIVIFLDREGNASANSYARTYYHFPRRQSAPDFTTQPDGGVGIQMVNGESMQLSPDVRLASYTGGKLELSKDTVIRPEDQGGIRIQPTTGVLVDFGWQRGKLPVEVKTREALVSDSRGKTCKLKNTDLLKYVLLPSGGLSHVELLHRTDVELAQFLRAKCPMIDVKDLEHSQ